MLQVLIRSDSTRWKNCLSARIQFLGNPRYYAVFIDESINLLLRTSGEHSHQCKFEERIFRSFNMIGKFGLNKYVYPPL